MSSTDHDRLSTSMIHEKAGAMISDFIQSQGRIEWTCPPDWWIPFFETMSNRRDQIAVEDANKASHVLYVLKRCEHDITCVCSWQRMYARISQSLSIEPVDGNLFYGFWIQAKDDIDMLDDMIDDRLFRSALKQEM